MQRIVIKGLIVTLLAEGVSVHKCAEYSSDCREPQKHIEQEQGGSSTDYWNGGRMSAVTSAVGTSTVARYFPRA